jgi:phage major head subunit gpT-like protein
LKSDACFYEKKFVYGVDLRDAVGFGLWQTAYRSQAALNETNLIAARNAMAAYTDDEGRKLGINGKLLVVQTSMEYDAKKLTTLPLINGGETNPLLGMFDLLVVPQL